MYGTMWSLGVIPARGGSKSVPRKNLRRLGGETLVVRCARAALATSTLEKIVLSTDDDEIAEAGTSAGVDVIRRPSELATDDAPTTATLIHAVRTLGSTPSWVVTLEPTAPFRRPETIDHCLRLAEEHDAGSVVTVRADTSCWGRVDDAGRFLPLEPGAPRRRQARRPLYSESGTVWVTRTTGLVAQETVLVEPVFAVVVSDVESMDINTELDLVIAQAILGTGEHNDRVPHR